MNVTLSKSEKICEYGVMQYAKVITPLGMYLLVLESQTIAYQVRRLSLSISYSYSN